MATSLSSRLIRKVCTLRSLLLSPLCHAPFLESSKYLDTGFNTNLTPLNAFENTWDIRAFCSRASSLDVEQGPATIDYSSLLQEDEYHKLADATISDLQGKFEEYGDCIQVDGFDIDYGNQVLTVKLGNLGTYVLNKQTPNRQLWLSSPDENPEKMQQEWEEDITVLYLLLKNSMATITPLETGCLDGCQMQRQVRFLRWYSYRTRCDIVSSTSLGDMPHA
ncbi:hypothetical protein AMTRI_Chr02g218070 [Amborella trichopoda]